MRKKYFAVKGNVFAYTCGQVGNLHCELTGFNI